MKEWSEEEALCKAAAYCSQAEHCRSEVSEKLDGWNIPPDGKARIMERLVKERYIDEERYVRSFVHDKWNGSRWGRNKIAQALRMKRIPSELVGLLWKEVDVGEYRSVLRNLLDAKRRTVKARNGYELTGKLVRFALGRGFEMDEIRRCLSMEDADDWMAE